MKLRKCQIVIIKTKIDNKKAKNSLGIMIDY